MSRGRTTEVRKRAAVMRESATAPTVIAEANVPCLGDWADDCLTVAVTLKAAARSRTLVVRFRDVYPFCFCVVRRKQFVCVHGLPITPDEQPFNLPLPGRIDANLLVLE